MGEELDRFLEELCWRRQYVIYIFVLGVTFAVIQLPYLVVVEPGAALYVLATINVVGFGAFALASGLLIRYCDAREQPG